MTLETLTEELMRGGIDAKQQRDEDIAPRDGVADVGGAREARPSRVAYCDESDRLVLM